MVALENNESSTEQPSVHLTAEPIRDECPQCRHRRETYSAIGLAVFSVSLLSCGILMPLSIVVAIIIQSLIAIGCKRLPSSQI